jgi:hypothetical protein
MSTREAAGYLVQLKDLYLLRFSKFGRPARSYRQFTATEVEDVISSRR